MSNPPERGFTQDQAAAVAAGLGLDFEEVSFDVDQFRRGMEVELEHGRRDPITDVTHDDPMITGQYPAGHTYARCRTTTTGSTSWSARPRDADRQRRTARRMT